MAKAKAGKIQKLGGRSMDVLADKIKDFKRIFPESVKDGKIDFDKLRLIVNGEISEEAEQYGLNWAGKSECFRHIQETTSATLKPDRKESIDFDKTENIFIEGDNLEVLKVLQRSYYGKIKMIYIDPPYNTGNDSFIYPDRFKEEKEDYELRAGIKDEEGLLTKDGFWRKNSKDSGHFHSNWLSMMYPRLFLARNLLRDDGVIFVSIDDNEVHNLRMIMNEIFGEENFIAQIIWEKIHSTKNDAKYMSDNHEYILCYARSLDSVAIKLLPRTEEMNERYQNPDNDPRGSWCSGDLVASEVRKGGYYDVAGPTGKIFNVPKGKHWAYTKVNLEEMIRDNRIWFGKNDDSFPRLKRFLAEVQQGKKVSTLWTNEEVGHNQEAKREVKKIFDERIIFDTSKPVRLVSQMLSLVTNSDKDDIILDFFSGSCTTAHAVMQLNAEDGGNRRYICVQMAEACDEESEAYKAGFKTIAEIGRERIRRAAKKIKKEQEGKLDFDGGKLDLGFKAFKLDKSSFKQWREDIKTGDELKEQMKLFTDNTRKDAKPEDMLFEIILKNSRYDLNVKAEKKSFDGIDYYNLAEGQEIICLAEKITKKLVDKILAEKPQKFTCLDTAFKNNDQLKTNTACQMKDKIEFKVI